MPKKDREKNRLMERLERISWPGGREEMAAIEAEVSGLVAIRPFKTTPSLVAGADAAFAGKVSVGAASLFTFPGLEATEDAVCTAETPIPYIPGYLSFREAGVIIRAIDRLSARPDAIIFDGQGIAHPRGLGIAAFAGAILDIPSVGAAKSRLVGEYIEPGPERGSTSALVYRGRKVGAVVRTRDNTRPLFVSPGHGIDIPGAIELVLRSTRGYRLTEPVRRADRLSRERARSMREKA